MIPDAPKRFAIVQPIDAAEQIFAGRRLPHQSRGGSFTLVVADGLCDRPLWLNSRKRRRSVLFLGVKLDGVDLQTGVVANGKGIDIGQF